MKHRKSIFIMIAIMIMMSSGIVCARSNLIIESCFDVLPDSFNQAPPGWAIAKVGGDYSWCDAFITAGERSGKADTDKYITIATDGLTPQAITAAGFSANAMVYDPYLTCIGNGNYPVMTYECSFLNEYDTGQLFAQNIWSSASEAETALRCSGGMLWWKNSPYQPIARIKEGRWYKVAVTVYENGKADVYVNGRQVKKNDPLFSKPLTLPIQRFKVFTMTDVGTEQRPGRGSVSIDNIRWYGGNYQENAEADTVRITSTGFEIDEENKYIYIPEEIDVKALKKQLNVNGTLEIYKDSDIYLKCTGNVENGAVAVAKSKSGEVFEYYDIIVKTPEAENLRICRTNESAAAAVVAKNMPPDGKKLILAVYDKDRLDNISVTDMSTEAISAKAEASADKTVKAFMCDFKDGRFDIIGWETAKVQTKDEAPESVLPTEEYIKSVLSGSAAFNVSGKYAFLNGDRVEIENGAYLDADSRIMVPVRQVCESFKASWNKNGDSVVVNSKKIAAEEKNGEAFAQAQELANAMGLPYMNYKNELAIIGKTVEKVELFPDVTALFGDAHTVWNLDEASRYLVYDRPTPEKLLEAFNENSIGVHPRVRTNAETFKRLKEQYAEGGDIKKYADEWLLLQANRIIQSGYLPKYVRNDGLRFDDGGNMYGTVPKLALAYVITGKEIYKDYLWKCTEELCSFPDWNAGRHFLDVSHAAAAVGMAYDWLYYEWTPQQREIMATAIYEKAFSELIKVYEGNPSVWSGSVNPPWERMEGNWNSICNGGMSMAAMAIMEEYPEKCAKLLSCMIHSLEYQMKCFAPDGGYKEGVGYWNYLMQTLQPTLASFDETFKTDFGLMEAPGFKETWKFPVSMTSNLGYVNNYSDSEGPTAYNLAMGNYFWFAGKFDMPQLGKLRLKLFEEGKDTIGITVSDILYYSDEFTETELQELPLDAYFGSDEVQAVAMRENYNDNNGAFLSYHALGELGQDHGHLDAGTYVLDMQGFRVAADLGSDDYNLPGMFHYAGQRNNYYRIRPEGHNLFVINPDSTFLGQNYGVYDRVEKHISKPRGAISVANLDNAYAGKAQKARRGFMMTDERRSVTVRDEILLNQAESEVYSMIHTTGQVEVKDNSTVIVTGANGKKVQIQFITNADSWEIKNMAAQPLPQSPKMSGQNANAGINRITFIMKTKNRTLYSAVRYTPLDSTLSEIPLTNVWIDDWKIPDGELTYDFAETPIISNITGMTNHKLTLSDVSRVPQPENAPENTLDGDNNTRWSTNGMGDWIKYDLGGLKTVSAIGISTLASDQRQTILDIEVSENGEDWVRIYEGKTPLQSGMAYFAVNDIKARYIRIAGYGNTSTGSGTWTSITEVMAFGK